MKQTTTTKNGLSFGGWAAVIFGVGLILFGLNAKAYIIAVLGLGITAVFFGGAFGAGGVGVLAGFVILFALLSFPADRDDRTTPTPTSKQEDSGPSLEDIQKDYYSADPGWG